MADFHPGTLGALPFLGPIETRMLSPENPSGARGGGARAVPDSSNPALPHSHHAVDLGEGWKVHPFERVPAHEELVIADIEGPGLISYFWITSDHPNFRALTLRMWWDNETTPSVEAPLGDFFGIGHDGCDYSVISAPVVVAPRRGLNCWWPMPFGEHCRISVTNDSNVDADVLAYKIVWHPTKLPDNPAYFHAQWRHSTTTRDLPEHTILDGVTGTGHYVGTSLAWTSMSSGWWGEGEVKFYLDGDKYPTICDTGTEDYVGGAWSFYADPARPKREVPYCAPYIGFPLADLSGEAGRRFSMYRWHIPDPIGFASDLRVTVQALGWYPDSTYQPLTDDIASVAYWYQHEPHGAFPAMEPLLRRWTR